MTRDTFDFIAYFKELTEKNHAAQENGFIAVEISSPDNLEGLFEEYRENDRFIAITDTNTGNMTSADGSVGFTNRRACTVFILSAYEYNNMEDRQQQLELCRMIFRQFASRIVRDKYKYDEQMMFFDTTSFPNQELGRGYLSGLTGLFFSLYESEPVELVYDEDEWDT